MSFATTNCASTWPNPQNPARNSKSNLRYEGKPTTGLYFILPDKDDPGRAKEIWTQGEAEDTHHYIPIYDYPNDRATSEMILTVPGDWLTVSNGKLLERAGRPGRPEDVDVAAILAGFHVPDFVRGRRIQGKEGHLAQHPGYVLRASRHGRHD